MYKNYDINRQIMQNIPDNLTITYMPQKKYFSSAFQPVHLKSGITGKTLFIEYLAFLKGVFRRGLLVSGSIG
ncbi:MAG: hypothetical protein A2270_02610 [Elusimicrobia bacterium RIFOXYA12_FULL_51_18]|nr:MAG: hypothetical protein A2270_02610 [Elusimicrobia bacterium RIFOXYA12_FULL_51_18]OGS31302.1 MAG: hypothetical protein A2218_08195 [Elusimicrobia bacterium RIFOXYA2_FULL_53_38]